MNARKQIEDILQPNLEDLFWSKEKYNYKARLNPIIEVITREIEEIRCNSFKHCPTCKNENLVELKARFF